MIQADDIVLLISKSGDSPEVLTPLVHFGNTLIGMVGNMKSYLHNSDIVLNTTVEQEACPNNCPHQQHHGIPVMGETHWLFAWMDQRIRSRSHSPDSRQGSTVRSSTNPVVPDRSGCSPSSISGLSGAAIILMDGLILRIPFNIGRILFTLQRSFRSLWHAYSLNEKSEQPIEMRMLPNPSLSEKFVRMSTVCHYSEGWKQVEPVIKPLQKPSIV